MKPPREAEYVADLQTELPDTTMRELAEHFSNAESCERFEDFKVNVEAAIAAAEELVKELRELLAQAPQT